MNLNQLSYFISVAETLNFTRAAEQCFISQTAMTQQISALERTVGTPLFVRDKHHVELTAAGRVYLNEARIILERSNEALRLARLASEGVEGELKIGFISGFGQRDFSRPLRDFHQSSPGIKIGLHSANLSILFENLNRKEYDLILTVSPKNREHEHMEHKYLKSYPILAVLPAGHPLSTKKALTFRELQAESFIMMEPSNRPMKQMEESILIYERGGYYPNIVAMEGNPETLLLMIAARMGISILPEYILSLHGQDEDLAIIPMVKEDGSTENIDFEADWLADNQNPALWRFLKLLSL